MVTSHLREGALWTLWAWLRQTSYGGASGTVKVVEVSSSSSAGCIMFARSRFTYSSVSAQRLLLGGASVTCLEVRRA
jgi:hypothetical protein